MKQITNLCKAILFITIVISMGACTSENLEASLDQHKTAESTVKDASGVLGFLKGAYDELTATAYYGRDFIINNEVRTDNCFANGKSGRFGTSALFDYNNTSGFFWGEAYKIINLANLIINVDASAFNATDKVAYENYKGQAYALRALVHYDLLTMYGQQNAGGTLGVPYMKKFISAASSETEFLPKRNSVSEVKSSVYADLAEAYKILTGSGKKLDDPANNIFISALATKAIEARVALYFGEWQKAQDAADIVIKSGQYKIMAKADYIGSWAKKQNSNSIFELPFSATDTRGINGLAYMYRNIEKGYGDVSANQEVKDALYDAGDVRLDVLGEEEWSGDAYIVNNAKYPDTDAGTDNVPVIRYEEVLLTSAEALVELNNTSGALALLNELAKERGVADYTEATKDIVLKERRRELIFEGLRFNDLMRNKKSLPQQLKAKVLGTIAWGDPKLAWPIPKREVDANSNMVQNKGY